MDLGIEYAKRLHGESEAMIGALETLVRAETPSEDLAACAAGAGVVSALAEAVLGD
ncbi:MAG: hypothetical protein QOJ50_3248, partial [Cryptosporangiaceae bacterium]|nr:hypothetical protein [Cryptosporangiaceae bacterium]